METKKSNAGKKSIKDKKITITFFIRQSVIDKFGGEEVVQKIVYDAIELIN